MTFYFHFVTFKNIIERRYILIARKHSHYCVFTVSIATDVDIFKKITI